MDDGCDCVVITEGGYEIMDLESKRSDDISMSAIVVRGDGKNEERGCVCVNECVIE